jgi:predicted nucleic acid-binding protein
MQGVMIETDVIAAFLTAGDGEQTLMRRLLEALPCYTTFLHAAEIYSAARDAEETRIVERALFGLKILGASGRYAKTIGRALTSVAAMRGHRTAIVAAMAIESGLPIVTDDHYTALSAIPGPRVIRAATLQSAHGMAELLSLLAPPL